MVDLVESHYVTGTNFGFELILNSLEKPLYKPAWRRVVGRPVQKPYVEAVTGGLEPV